MSLFDDEFLMYLINVKLTGCSVNSNYMKLIIDKHCIMVVSAQLIFNELVLCVCFLDWQTLFAL